MRLSQWDIAAKIIAHVTKRLPLDAAERAVYASPRLVALVSSGRKTPAQAARMIKGNR